MKIFISSLISGFEPLRAAAREAIETLGHAPVMAEKFPAQPHSPQIACLKGVREADLVVLILGAAYGTVQGTSGVSPTHEEYLEARGKKPILVFVQNRVTREPQQNAFVNEVQGWQGGFIRAGFDDRNDLRPAIIRAIHEFQLAHAVAPLDVRQLETQAKALLVTKDRRRKSDSPALKMAFVGGPMQSILRPALLEKKSLREALTQHALFGTDRLLTTSERTTDGIDREALFIAQEDGSLIQLNEQGSVLIRRALEDKSRERYSFNFALIEETVLEAILGMIGYASWVLEQIDSTQHLTHVGIAVTIESAKYLGWRTQAEQDASPNSGQIMNYVNDEERAPICVNRPRGALQFNKQELAEDLMVPLRRQFR